MESNQIGSMAWARLTGGSLRKNERLHLVAQAMLYRLSALPARALRKFGMTASAVTKIDLGRIRVPDTRAAQEALDLCTQASPAFLVNHCVRTYLWGALLAAGAELEYDEELFYVASILHDLGLTDHAHDGNCSCFAAQGALAATSFARSQGWPQDRQSALADAICLHLNVRVDPDLGMEAHLVHEGAAMDVVGARIREVHRDTRDAVLAHHPRLGFKTEINDLLRHQANIRPASRMGFLVQMGFSGLIARSLFDE
jgi:hypothetical protein